MPRPPRRTTVRLGLVAPVLLATLAGCGASSDPEPLEALPPAAPDDLCALLPAADTTGLTGTSSSSQEGDPTAACAMYDAAGDTLLVTYLQLGDLASARSAWETQCAAIDPTVLPERQARVDGADETCAGAGDGRASLAVVAGRDLLTVRAQTDEPLARATSVASGVLDGLPTVE